MTTPPLPPEIKSAEEHAIQMMQPAWMREAVELQNQRDLAIWNAAIEKAAISLHSYTAHPNAETIDEVVELNKQAILNLKQKEWCEKIFIYQ